MAKPTKKPEKAKDAEKPQANKSSRRIAPLPTTIISLRSWKPGLVLHGTEVKALREGKANIRDAYRGF